MSILNLTRTPITLADSSSIDAFGRLRVSSPENIFDSKQLFDKQPLKWDEEITGTGSSTHSQDKACVLMNNGVTNGNIILRQTFRAMNYQPGKSQLFEMTFAMGASDANCVREVGQFDDDNGVFFRYSNVASFVLRSKASGSVVETVVNQSNWNLDKLDGTGASGITLNPNGTNIFFYDYQWLGVGRVRYGFVIDGVPVICHEINNANAGQTTVFMSTPNLPLRYRIENTATLSSAITMSHICSTVFQEGGQSFVGSTFGVTSAAGTNKVRLGFNNQLVSVVKIRIKSGFKGANVIIDNVEILSEEATSRIIRFAGVCNPTYSGGSDSWTSVSNSAVEFDFTSERVVTGADVFHFESFGGSRVQQNVATDQDSPIYLGHDIAGNSQVFALVAERLTSNNTDVFGAINWKEL